MAKNKVLAVHSRKMMDTKYLTKKSAADMVAIFGVRDDVYSLSAVVKPKSNPSTPSDGGVDGGASEGNKMSRDKKGGDDDIRLSGKRKKKIKRSSE